MINIFIFFNQKNWTKYECGLCLFHISVPYLVMVLKQNGFHKISSFSSCLQHCVQSFKIHCFMQRYVNALPCKRIIQCLMYVLFKFCANVQFTEIATIPRLPECLQPLIFNGTFIVFFNIFCNLLTNSKMKYHCCAYFTTD